MRTFIGFLTMLVFGALALTLIVAGAASFLYPAEIVRSFVLEADDLYLRIGAGMLIAAGIAILALIRAASRP